MDDLKELLSTNLDGTVKETIHLQHLVAIERLFLMGEQIELNNKKPPVPLTDPIHQILEDEFNYLTKASTALETVYKNLADLQYLRHKHNR